MSDPNTIRSYRLSRRHLVGGAVAAGGLAVAPRLTRAAQETDWLHAEDISTMPDTKIRYWFFETPEGTELGKRQLQEFHERFPNITVEGRTAPPDVDNEQLLAFIKSGTNSHVHQTVSNEDTWYIRHDLIQPLEDLPGFQEVWDQLAPRYNYTWTDGHVYSLSWYADPMAMYYNKQLVVDAGLDPEQPPATYSEYLKWAEALTKDTNQWFISLDVGEEWWYYEFVHYPFYIAATNTNQLHDKDGKKAIFNTPEALKSYELVNEIFRKGYSAEGPFDVDPFVSGVAAASLQGPWMLSQIQQSAPEGFEFIVGPIPRPDDAEHDSNPTFDFVRSFNLMREQEKTGEEADRINRAAWELMKFLLSSGEQAAYFAVSGDFPAANDFPTNPLYSEPLDNLGPQARWLADYAEQGFPYEMNTLYESESMAILQETWAKMALGEATPQETLDEAERRVNELLANPPTD
jgi:multiple sugar transport system substrate-binding protein